LKEFGSKAIKSGQGEEAHNYSATDRTATKANNGWKKVSNLLLSLENNKLLARQREAQPGFPLKRFVLGYLCKIALLPVVY